MVLLAGPAPLLSRRAFWRAVTSFHPVALATIAFSLLVPVVALLTLRLQPGVALLLSWLVIAGAAVSTFLARPGRGKRTGWPAGSLGWWGSVLSLLDPGEYARRSERHGDVFKIRQMHRPVVCLTDLAVGAGLLRDHHEDLGPATLPYNDLVPGGFVRYLRGAEHRSRRTALQRGLNRRAVNEMETSLHASVRSGVRVLVDREPWHPNEIEWPILHAMVVAFLGPVASGVLHESTSNLVRALSSGSERDLRALMADLPRGPAAPSVMSTLVEQFGDETAEDRAEREKVLGNAAFMLHLGWRDLSGLAAWLVVECARRPELLAAVREQPGHSAHIVDETLRLRQSEYVYRKATADIPIGDQVIPKGWLVRVCVREAHRSATHFREPDTFDPARFDEECPYGRPAPERYQPFGLDHHNCIGADLTRTIGRLLVEELAAYELTVVRDTAAAVGGRHWRHVAPAPRVRVRLRRPGPVRGLGPAVR